MSKVKLTGKLLSIQLGRENTQIALIQKGAAPLHTISVPTPAGAVEDGVIRDQEGIIAMLKGALRAPEFRGVRQAVFCLCSSQIISQTVTTPDLPAARLEKLLQANVDVYFPVDMRNYRLLWQVIGPNPKSESGAAELQVQLWAAPQELLAGYYPVANACGLAVAALDYCGRSIAAAVGASFTRPVKHGRSPEKKKLTLTTEITFRKKPKETVEEPSPAPGAPRQNPDTSVHLVLEPDMMLMSFVQEGQVKMQQYIRCGQRPADQFSDLSMSLEYFRSLDMGRGSQIRGVLSGTLASDEAFTAELADMLGISLSLLETAYDPMYALCVGAAATGMDFGNAALNHLRKKPGRVATFLQTQLWQYLLIAVGGGVLAMSIMSLMSDRTIWQAEIDALESDRQVLAIQAQQAGQYADKYEKYSNIYNNYSSDWDTIFGSLHTNNDNLVLVLNELESILPADASVLNMSISEDGIQVDFACVDKEQAAYLIQALRALEYADLAYVSNLTGGGGGAYEAPPTEGSYTLYGEASSQNDPLKDMVAAELTKEELIGLAGSMTDDDIRVLESCYGKPAPALHSSYASLMQNRDKKALFDQRAAALEEMLSTNPFAAKLFTELVKADYERAGDGKAVLFWTISDDIFDLNEQGLLTEETLRNPSKLRQNMDLLLGILIQDEKHLSDTEKLICYRSSGTSKQDELLNEKHQKLEAWYVYYLEVELGVQQEQQLPYLNVDAIIADLLDDGYLDTNSNPSDNTDSTKLDGKLNNLVSEDAHNMMAELGTEEGMAKLVDKYVQNGGKTGYDYVDRLITNYFTTGTTGNDLIDDQIAKTFESGLLDKTVQGLVDDYFKNGTTKNDLFDAKLDAYFASGDSGNRYIDNIIDDYLESTALENVMADLMEKYLTSGNSGNPKLNPLLQDYLDYEIRTSGNSDLDKLFLRSLKTSKVTTAIKSMLNKYKSSKESGSTVMNKIINCYNSNGTTGNAYLNTLCRDVLGNPTSAPSIAPNEELTVEMLDRYMSSGKTGNEQYDELVSRFFRDGSSGDGATDTIIEDYISNKANENKLNQKFALYLKTGSCGNDHINAAFDNYLNNSNCKNKLLTLAVRECLESEDAEQAINEALKAYSSDGKCQNAALSKQFDKYVQYGETDHPQLDWIIEDYMDGLITEDNLPDLMDDYLKNNTSGNVLVDAMFDDYLTVGSTGNKALDRMIDEFLDTDEGKRIIDDAVNRFMNSFGTTTGNKTLDRVALNHFSGSSHVCGNKKLCVMFDEYYNNYNGGGNQGGETPDPIIPIIPGGPTEDTRIKFSVQLTYKEELKLVEQDREGLNKDDKIEKLEVDN